MRVTRTYSIEHHSWLKTALKGLKIALWASVALFVVFVAWSLLFDYGKTVVNILVR